MKAEYSAVCKDIDETQKYLEELPLLSVPLDDLKAAILEFVDLRGRDYLDDVVKSKIKQFSTNGMGGMSNPERLGTPLSFKELDKALTGYGAYTQAQLATEYNDGFFSDMALYAFFGALVKKGLADAMETMTPADFGYTKLHPHQIGTDRETRYASIQAAQDRLAVLHAKKEEIGGGLRQLGVTIPGKL